MTSRRKSSIPSSTTRSATGKRPSKIPSARSNPPTPSPPPATIHLRSVWSTPHLYSKKSSSTWAASNPATWARRKAGVSNAMKLTLYVILASAAFAQPPADAPYLNPDLPADQRAADLVSRMTLEEKVLQMQNGAPALPRLNIPAYDWWNEALHGVARAGRATVFPQAIALAVTWDTDLMFRIADVISTEARAKYNEAIRNNQHGRYQGLTFWSPNINIFRDPRWGRGQETYGEDPYLTGRMAVAFITGMQGMDSHYYKVIATAKHYAAHSGPES